MVSMVAFQAVDPGSIPGRRNFYTPLIRVLIPTVRNIMHSEKWYKLIEISERIFFYIDILIQEYKIQNMYTFLNHWMPL